MIVAARILAILSLIPLLAAVWPSDRWALLALIAYIPPVLCAVGAGVATALFARRSAPLPWSAVAIAGLILALTAVAADNHALLGSSSGARGLAIAHWDIAHRGKSAADLDALHADVICLSEAPHEWQPPAGWHAERQGLLVVLARAPIRRLADYDEPGFNGIHVEVEGRTIALLDVTASPFVHRRRPLAFWTPAERPDVVTGDLNTPAGSFSLRERFTGYADAYGLAGRGPAYTWPSYLPVMKIDHILAREGLRVLDYTTGFAWSSDHRYQRVVVER